MTTPNKPDADGWFQHDGGECPVPPELPFVQVNKKLSPLLIGEISWETVWCYRHLIPKHELDAALVRIAELEKHIAKLPESLK